MEAKDSSTTASPHEAELTDHSIEHLLLEAENRLRTRASVQVTKDLELPSSRVPQLSHDCAQQLYVREEDDIVTADSSRVNSDVKKTVSTLPHPVQDSLADDAPLRNQEKQTAGADWFNMPKTELTPELKRDLQILRMRSVLDPKRHYKKENGKVRPPQYSHMGTIIEGPGEFFSGRVTKKDRKKTFVEEVLASERETHRFKLKYQGIQATKQNGKGLYYKNLRAKRNTKGK